VLLRPHRPQPYSMRSGICGFAGNAIDWRPPNGLGSRGLSFWTVVAVDRRLSRSLIISVYRPPPSSCSPICSCLLSPQLSEYLYSEPNRRGRQQVEAPRLCSTFRHRLLIAKRNAVEYHDASRITKPVGLPLALHLRSELRFCMFR